MAQPGGTATDLEASVHMHVPRHPVRFVTAASLFDGHDAAINIMRRLLQAQGAEVVHLGHDRSVDDVVTAVIQEDAQGVAISSYQGGHVEYFGYLVERLRAAGAGHVRVYGGGGGVIVQSEIDELARIGVRIFSPSDGQRLGLRGMINELIRECDIDLAGEGPDAIALATGEPRALARAITVLQSRPSSEMADSIRMLIEGRRIPVLGVTGTGGSGKSSLTDELVRRLRRDSQDKLRIAVVAIDPTRRKGGGALLGDRIRMNAISADTVFYRSMATREASMVIPACVDDVLGVLAVAGYDLAVVETPGIGQGDAAIVPHADVSLYVMTADYAFADSFEVGLALVLDGLARLRDAYP